LEAIASYAHDPQYRRFLGEGHPAPAQFVANNLTLDATREESWVILLNGVIVGTVFLGIDPVRRSGELACLVAPAYWRQGIAVEATGAVIEHGFRARRLVELTARADVRNVGSIATMEKLGMQRLQVLQEPVTGPGGERRDTVVFRLLSPEWESR
jgi:RimJ/RimL family protein N-acetyltransferase